MHCMQAQKAESSIEPHSNLKAVLCLFGDVYTSKHSKKKKKSKKCSNHKQLKVSDKTHGNLMQV